jgi:hypothetical protein
MPLKGAVEVDALYRTTDGGRAWRARCRNQPRAGRPGVWFPGRSDGVTRTFGLKILIFLNVRVASRVSRTDLYRGSAGIASSSASV